MNRIPIARPVFDEQDRAAVLKPLESGWVVQGPYVKQFEDRFSAFTGAPFSVATSSCTAALHIAVAALGLKPGDEVIVPAFTWVSTANVVEYLGAAPVFCDVDLATFNIDPDHIAALITPRTVGIIPVHLFGLCADMAPILKLARAHGLWVVEDAACGLGARYHGRHAGTMGDAGCFSFHPRKAITTGEGGMITTNREELDGLARSLRDHGASRSDRARHEGQDAFLLAEYDRLGFNYRLTDLQGALGCAQMDRLERILTERASLARRYDEILQDADWLEAPKAPDGHEHGYQAYVCLFRPETPTLRNADRLHRWRNDVMRKLEAAGIATRQGTHAPVRLGYYARKYGLKPEQFPRAYLADRLSLALPLFPRMTEAEQVTVAAELRRAFSTTIVGRL
ncbi:MAG: DegT/DnrJ/EryC1/StrS family aminotransferase [Nitrospirota bacterium]